MEAIIYLLKEILSPVILSILTTLITLKIKEKIKIKSESPKLYLHIPLVATAPEENDLTKGEGSLIKGCFRLEQKFDDDLEEFLKQNDFEVDLGIQNKMNYIVESFINEEYKEVTKWHPSKEVNEIVSKFKDNPKFLNMIERYQRYKEHSKWILEIENVGSTDAYDMKFNYFRGNLNGGCFESGNLTVGKRRKVILYYFDNAMEVDKLGKSARWNNNIKTIFYLVDKNKYNPKDEQLFNISYNDKYGNLYNMYCCAKVGKRDLIREE